MKLTTYIDSLVSYAVERGLAEPEDRQVLTNRLLEMMGQVAYIPSDEPLIQDIEKILAGLLDYAVQKGLCDDNILARDLFDTRLMGALTPMPREVRRTFWEKYARNPREATDWYYQFSGDTDYIRRYRIAKDLRWKYNSPYGELDITINLSKPEKDPVAAAAAKYAPQSDYPKCLLCAENEGYGGRMNHPSRANHRIIPLELTGKRWYLQYSPYVYYIRSAVPSLPSQALTFRRRSRPRRACRPPQAAANQNRIRRSSSCRRSSSIRRRRPCPPADSPGRSRRHRRGLPCRRLRRPRPRSRDGRRGRADCSDPGPRRTSPRRSRS